MKHEQLTRAQRVVIILAIGFALYVLCGWVTSLGVHLPYGSGAYTNVSDNNVVGGMADWLRWTIRTLLLGTWAALATWLLNSRRG
jgi:ABC-type branched-subunit amino acid transport system permease subunit